MSFCRTLKRKKQKIKEQQQAIERKKKAEEEQGLHDKPVKQIRHRANPKNLLISLLAVTASLPTHEYL